MVFKISTETCLSNLQLPEVNIKWCPNHNYTEHYKPHFWYCQVIKQDIFFSMLCKSCGWFSVRSQPEMFLARILGKLCFVKLTFALRKLWHNIITFSFIHIKPLVWGIVVQKEFMYVVIKELECHMDHTHQILVLNIFWNFRLNWNLLHVDIWWHHGIFWVGLVN
jgi:hypothetical protein